MHSALQLWVEALMKPDVHDCRAAPGLDRQYAPTSATCRKSLLLIASHYPGAGNAEKLMLVLRDGRKMIGVLRSWDQFGAS